MVGDHAKAVNNSTVFARLLIICFWSLVVMAESARVCHNTRRCSGYHGWAVACSVVSAVLSGALLALWKLGIIPEPWLPVPRGNIVTALFLFVWWSIGAGAMTFKSPFVADISSSANGYFGAWINFLVSTAMIIPLIPQLGDAVSGIVSAGTDLAAIFFASFVLLIQSGVDCDKGDCNGKLIWAIILSCFSLIISCLGIFFRDKIPQQPFAAFLLVWWLAGWSVITFHGPYEEFGNGYVATSIGFFFSAKYFLVITGLFRFIEDAAGAKEDADVPPSVEFGTRAATAPPPEQSTLSYPPAPTEKAPADVPPDSAPPATAYSEFTGELTQ